MKTVRLLALLVVAVVSGAAAAASTAERVLAVEWSSSGGELRWLDARTLSATGGGIAIGRPPASPPAVSPDGELAAIGSARHELRLVGLSPLRPVGRVALPGFVRGLAWPTPDRIHVVTVGSATNLIVLDGKGRAVDQRRLAGEALQTVVAGRRLLVLSAPRLGIANARLHVVDERGKVQTVELPGIGAGFARAARAGGSARSAYPGLAADERGMRAAVAGRDRIMTVDLATLRTKTVPLVLRRPARRAKLVAGWSRSAAWAGEDAIAISGSESGERDGRSVSTPSGAVLVDLLTGEVRGLDDRASGVIRAGGALLSFGGLGLRAYDADGTRIFELVRDTDTGYLETSGRYAYVGGNNSHRFVVVDIAAGRVLGIANLRAQTVLLR